MKNKLHDSLVYFMFIVYFARTVHGTENHIPPDEDNHYERAEEVDIRNGSTFLSLDKYIYDVIVDPTKGTGPELLNKFEILTHCMRKAQTMFTPENEEKDYAIRAAALIFFNWGGPMFNRIPLYNEENTLPLKREFNWTDEDVKKLEQKQLEAERAWNKLKRSIL